MTRAIPRWAIALALILGLLSAGTCVNFVLVGSALKRVGEQAKTGQLANERQCELFPISRKLYDGAARFGLISADEYQRYLEVGAPKKCPHPGARKP